MQSHRYNWREEPQGTALSSILLLLIFVAAAIFLVGMVVMTPWDDGPATPTTEVQVPPPSPAEGAPAQSVEQAAPAQ